MTSKANLKIVTESVAETGRERLKIVIVGHVDHGKSTLVGRLFHDTDSLPEGKFEQIKAMCEKRGMPFEYSFLMDALQAERDQGITIDTSQIWFKTAFRDYVIIDAPGHKEFLKNMISGAANSEAALLIIDAKEGVKEQSKRHGYLLHLLGIRQIAVAVNKMDLVGYSESHFNEISKEYTAYLKSIGVTPTFMIPISGREGDNITTPSPHMPWFKGKTIVDALDAFKPLPEKQDQPLRFPVQDVYKFDERRIIAGRIESGSLSVGDEIIISPTNHRVKVESIECFGVEQLPMIGIAGQSVGVTLSEQLFIERGHVISHVDTAPQLTNVFKARLFWLGTEPLVRNKRYLVKIGTSELFVELKSIEQIVDTDNLSRSQADHIKRHEVAEVTFKIKGLAPLDNFIDNDRTGRFVVMENYRIVGGGIIDLEGCPNLRIDKHVRSTNIHAVDSKISAKQRAYQNGHLGGVLWFSGLSGSGKTTLALELQNRLFAKGYQVYVLDGDNIRGGLNSDLAFSPSDRSENIRRVGEVAALFADAGTIVISAFISPYRHDRQRASAAAPNRFHSIYLQAPVEACEQRDPKGLYKKARKGEIKDFTGISAPFEEPENADLVLDTVKDTINDCIEQLLAYVDEHLVKPVRDHSGRYSDFVASDI